MKRLIVLASILLQGAMCYVVPSETGCPPADDIEPCKCYSSPSPVLECMHVNDVEILRQVFQNSERYTYNEVHIEFSSLPYLPHDMFEKTSVYSIYLKNVTLVSLFDSPPESLDKLDNLFIENTEVIGRSRWDLLEPFTQLRVLSIYFNTIRTLDGSFGEYVTKNLQQLILYSTGTEEIKPGALSQFVNLNKVTIDSCKLTELSRDMFPRPFNVKVLYFNDNKLRSIPDDLFTDMPYLQTLGLRNNLISVIPEAAFDGRAKDITYFRFDGNPLKCDCLLQWLIRDKPKVLGGSCASPKGMYGTDLKDIQLSSLNC